MGNALIGVLSAAVTGFLLLLGTRFVARQSREVGEQQVEVEQRKVDQEAFDRFVTRYEADRTRQDEELEETRTELRETRSLFRTALKTPSAPTRYRALNTPRPVVTVTQSPVLSAPTNAVLP